MDHQGWNSFRAHLIARTRIGALALAFALASMAAQAATSSSADAQAHSYAIANALAAAAEVQARVVDYSKRNNKFPASNVELALADPAAWSSADVKRVAVHEAGVIELTLTASSGVDDGIIVLTPTMPKNDAGGAIEWHCASPSYNTIADMTHGTCEYSKLP